MNKKVDWIGVAMVVGTAGICMWRIGSRSFDAGVKFAVDSLNEKFKECGVVFTQGAENEYAKVTYELHKKRK